MIFWHILPALLLILTLQVILQYRFIPECLGNNELSKKCQDFLGCSFATQLTGNNSLPSCIPEESESRKSPWLETTIEPEH